MKAYKARIDLGNPVNMQQQARHITASEIHLLRVIHGETAVVNVRNDGEVDRTREEEFERLRGFYKMEHLAKAFPAGTSSMLDVISDDQRFLPPTEDEDEPVTVEKKPAAKKKAAAHASA